MNNKNEKGIALILTMILVLIMSVMAVSLMFISQSETWASLNYRLASQARDGAEAGVHSAANFLINNYTVPGGTGDPITAYNYSSVYPVQAGATHTSGHDVYLSANTSQQASTYPASAVQTAYNTAGNGKGSLTVGNSTVSYATTAKLLSMTQLNSPISGSSAVVQTWLITSDGSVSGIRSANVEVSATLERTIVPTFNYATFGSNNGCAALTFGGGGSTNSYDSSTYSGVGTPPTSNTFGNIGTNGNVATNGGTTVINGTLSTPRSGIGTCSAGNITAWTDHSGTVTGSIIELPQPIVFPPPPTPNPVPPSDSHNAITISNSDTCNAGSGCIPSTGLCPSGYCLKPGTCPPADPGTGNSGAGVYGDLTVKGNLHLSAGCYNINSLTENGGGTLTIDSGPVVLNIAGAGTTTPFTLTGGGLVNSALPAFNSASLQILYAGTGAIKLAGGATSIGVMYAPNASFSLTGGADWYGSLIGATLTDMGGSAIHYDRHLQVEDFIPGNWMLESFSWKKD